MSAKPVVLGNSGRFMALSKLNWLSLRADLFSAIIIPAAEYHRVVTHGQEGAIPMRSPSRFFGNVIAVQSSTRPKTPCHRTIRGLPWIPGRLRFPPSPLPETTHSCTRRWSEERHRDSTSTCAAR